MEANELYQEQTRDNKPAASRGRQGDFRSNGNGGFRRDGRRVRNGKFWASFRGIFPGRSYFGVHVFQICFLTINRCASLLILSY